MPRKSRQTKQKELVSKEIAKFKTFFRAEDVLEKVKKHNISLATIYRYLKELREHNQIFSYSCDGKLIYSTENKSHCHFVCEETGEIIHFDIDSLDFLKDKIPGTISSFQIEVKGKCDKCCKN